MCLLAAVERAPELYSMRRCVAALPRGRGAAIRSPYLYARHNAPARWGHVADSVRSTRWPAPSRSLGGQVSGDGPHRLPPVTDLTSGPESAGVVSGVEPQPAGGVPGEQVVPGAAVHVAGRCQGSHRLPAPGSGQGAPGDATVPVAAVEPEPPGPVAGQDVGPFVAREVANAQDGGHALPPSADQASLLDGPVADHGEEPQFPGCVAGEQVSAAVSGHVTRARGGHAA